MPKSEEDSHVIAGLFLLTIALFGIAFAFGAVWTADMNLSAKFAGSAVICIAIFIIGGIGWAIFQIEDEPPLQKTDKVPEQLDG